MLNKNKKGELWIVALVLLIFLLTTATLFTFATSSDKIEVEISDARFLQDSYIKEGNVKNYLSLALEEAIVEAYKDITDNEGYIEDPVIINSEGEIEFNDLAADVNSVFLEKVRSNFQSIFLGYDYDENYLIKAELYVDSDNFEITFEEAVFDLSLLEKIPFEDSYKQIVWRYTPLIEVSSSLKKVGLESFEDIYSVKEDCKVFEDIQTCMQNKILNFNIVVEDKKDLSDNEYKLIKFTSKREFLINNNFEKINFEFVLN